MPVIKTRQPDGTWAEIPTIVGPQGKQGEPFKYEDFTAEQLQALRGKDGKDGYTPVKGVDYFDGAKGEPGASGVYIGTGTPLETANVWVNPTGEPTSTEDWEFDLDDGSTETKTVVVVGSDEATANGQLGILRVRQADGSWKEIPALVGTPGKDGVDGKDGQDGYTPVKGKDYFDGVDGKDGSNGKDGVSPAVSVSAITGGHRITITDASGTKTVDVMDGSDGQNGNDGAAGRGIKTIARTSGNGAAGTTDTYTITYTDNTTSTFAVYNGKDGSNGKDGTSVTVANVSESTADGGNNVVTFSDGKTITVKNGGKGDKGDKGDPGTTDFNALENKPTTENWKFTLEDGTIVTKAVYVG